MSTFSDLQQNLTSQSRRWLVTGVAGFIGSNLLEHLLQLQQFVVGIDNFATGHRRNLEQVQASVGAEKWGRFRFVEADIGDLEVCRGVCQGINYVLHQAALGSVPRSIANPLATNAANVTGTLNVLVAARDAKVERVVYASSSSVYGDHPQLPKVEGVIGNPLSPYAVSKLVDELYAQVFTRCYGLPTVGLRYFNVFGPRQDPNGPYAAVIPKWIAALIRKEVVTINGDGKTSRDFCYIANVIQANLLAATTATPGAASQVYNVAVHQQTSLNELFTMLKQQLAARFPHVAAAQPVYHEFRPGDVRHSLADVTRAKEQLGYQPTHTIEQGLEEALAWYERNVV